MGTGAGSGLGRGRGHGSGKKEVNITQSTANLAAVGETKTLPFEGQPEKSITIWTFNIQFHDINDYDNGSNPNESRGQVTR